MATLITDHLAPGSRVMDVGAGVTPLPPFLTSVATWSTPSTRPPRSGTGPPQPEWNEWDFLDYGAAGLAHRSWNCTARPRFPSIRRSTGSTR